ncbi:MAG: sugar transferase [Anaerolineales bacterium]|jgi:lipopolysaccharide/colanic/teichoic acid biosynthesis glycosyltransferase
MTFEQYLKLKRVLDVSFCIFLIPFLIIPFILISLAIVIDSPGSPVFSQERVGYRGKKFRILKFRTLWKDYDDKEDRKYMKSYINGGVADHSPEDERVAKFKPLHNHDVTRVGKILRKTSLDELPQIINVLRGEMTIVGPRPNVVWEVDAYKPWHYVRLNVQPGITGLAQVLGRSEISFDDIVRYDIQYTKNQSLHMDAWIFRRTLNAILDRNGAG